MRSQSFYLIILVTIAFIFIGCETGTQQRLNCICLIDYSGSLPDKTLQRYIQIISSEIFHHLDEKDRLIVLPIDEGAKTEPVKIVYEDFAEKRFSFPSDGYAHARDSLLKRIRFYVDATSPQIASELETQKEIRKKFTYLTDIFSALEQANILIENNQDDTFLGSLGRFFTGKKRIQTTNIIVIFSDMIQESNECSFARPWGCNPKEVKVIIGALKAHDRIPNLLGCKVFVNGRTGKSNLQVENIRNFWIQYFKESKADLLAYDYDSGEEITSFLSHWKNSR
ncbi:MAG: hypothetical protein KGJ59_03610 [Bacteroidota bacterium]|nr:hypothetical protein [Bacteroidota bacterium]